MKSFIKGLLNFVIYIAVVVATIYGLPKFLAWYLDTPYPMAAITSGSMWPVLHEGDLVFIEGVRREDLAVGDIVVYRNKTGGGFTIHRVVELRDEKFVTKGDANFEPDAPVGYENVIGRTHEVFGRDLRVPYLGMITVMANVSK